MNHLPRQAGCLFLWMGIASLAFGLFVHITRKLLEGDFDLVDRMILLFVVKIRSPWLTLAAVDLTALGSVSLVVSFSSLSGTESEFCSFFAPTSEQFSGPGCIGGHIPVCAAVSYVSVIGEAVWIAVPAA